MTPDPKEIRPALTPQQWADGGWVLGCEVAAYIDGTHPFDRVKFVVLGAYADIPTAASIRSMRINAYFDNQHGLAALCLHQKPYGFTQEDVDWLNERWLATISTMPDDEPHPKDAIAHDAWEQRQRTWRIARSLGSRIASLLPPSDSEAP
jgi:hypothetical protein